MKTQFASHLPDGWMPYSRMFAALGDETRQKILLIFEHDEEICVNDIARLFQISRPAISHHLKVLRNAGLVTSEKRGKEVYYSVNRQYFANVLEIVYRTMAEKQKQGQLAN